MADYDDSGDELEFSPDFSSAIDFSELGSGFAGDIGNVGLTPDSLQALLNDPELMAEFAKVYPDAANILQGFPTDAEMKDLSEQAKADVAPGGVMSGNPFGTQTGGTRPQTFLEKLGIGKGSDGKGILGTGISGSDLAKYGLLAGIAKLAYDDAEKARKAKLGYIAPGGSAKRAVISPGGSVSYTKAASGGIMSLADGGLVNERPVFIDAGVMDEKGPEDYGIGSLSDQYAFMEANMPAGEASQFDMYGNLIMPDPYFRTLTGSETNQLERDAAREYYKNPENARLSYEIAKNLEDAVIAKGGMGEVDVQETLRNIYNDPELKNMFFNYTGELKYAPMEAADLLDKDYELNKREAEGFTPDNNYVPGLAYELDMVNRNNPRIGHALEREMLKLIDPNAPRTFFRNYDYEEGEGNIRRGGGEGGIGGGYGGAAGGIASLQPKRKQPFYLGGPTDGMADQIPAHIDNQRPAALSDGEFVIPADVVSHLGNGNSNAGAKRLYEMMDSIREARTGNSKQGKQINPNKFLPR